MSIVRRDADALQQLSRSELQFLAHKEGIKANQKSVVIIQQLLEKHPKGVPRQATPKPSAALVKSLLSGKVGPSNVGREEPDTSTSNVVGSSSSRLVVDSIVRVPTVPPTIATVPTSASPARPKRQLGKSQATHQHRTRADIEQWQTTNARAAGADTGPSVMNPSAKRARVSANVTEIPTQPAKKQKIGPGPKDVRYVLCQLSKNINYLPHYERTLRNMTSVLGEAKEICDNLEKEIDAMCMFRWLVEEDVVRKMKQDKSLVDGTTSLGSNDLKN
ncbi:hypothetical protein Moror_17750 [Moniliophthora roreri MCA 2997]|uniref:Uncharacterized protein n=2 Tax=Moniliophthora roreri TaxID=221103 RepID=V2Z032_MONRO|nr:hypothetical protein Moror_17750 [Moniliophthora roreri MCA 2997]KAI3618857.1 hypothetical protein WG66_000509 [Moniliophthora roreri]